MEIPKLIKGGVSVDDRGVVQYVNDFDFAGVKRFYTIQNHRVGFVRAWHGHRQEAKYVTVLSGDALVCVVGLEDLVAVHQWFCVGPDMDIGGQPSVNAHRFILSSRSPAVLYIPGGHANGSMALSEDTIIVHFSTMTMEETAGDDVRFPASYFSDVWEVKQR